jgi:hypothetical protein
MKAKHLFWGFLFITLGVLILLNNFTTINFYWINFWKLWPVFLILLGISLLIKETVIRNILISLTAIALAVSIFVTVVSGWRVLDDKIIVNFGNGIEISDEGFNDREVKNFYEEYKPEIEFASLDFKAGGGAFRLADTSSYLFEAEAKGFNENFTLSRSDNENESSIHFTKEKTRFSITKGKLKNRIDFKLNPNPVWRLDFDLGAATTELDLKPFKVKEVNIDVGAASLKIKLGDLADTSLVNIDAGASSIEIEVPENAGCEIKTDVSLSSKKFRDFKKVKSDLYRTENFDTADKKIFIEIDSGVSSIKVERY